MLAASVGETDEAKELRSDYTFFLPVRFATFHSMVYFRCMVRTNVDIDDKACAEVMRRYRFNTKRDAINFALRTLAAEPLSVDDARALRGIGWEGDLNVLRTNRLP